MRTSTSAENGSWHYKNVAKTLDHKEFLSYKLERKKGRRGRRHLLGKDANISLEEVLDHTNELLMLSKMSATSKHLDAKLLVFLCQHSILSRLIGIITGIPELHGIDVSNPRTAEKLRNRYSVLVSELFCSQIGHAYLLPTLINGDYSAVRDMQQKVNVYQYKREWRARNGSFLGSRSQSSDTSESPLSSSGSTVSLVSEEPCEVCKESVDDEGKTAATATATATTTAEATTTTTNDSSSNSVNSTALPRKGSRFQQQIAQLRISVSVNNDSNGAANESKRPASPVRYIFTRKQESIFSRGSPTKKTKAPTFRKKEAREDNTSGSFFECLRVGAAIGFAASIETSGVAATAFMDQAVNGNNYVGDLHLHELFSVFDSTDCVSPIVINLLQRIVASIIQALHGNDLMWFIHDSGPSFIAKLLAHFRTEGTSALITKLATYRHEPDDNDSDHSIETQEAQDTSNRVNTENTSDYALSVIISDEECSTGSDGSDVDALFEATSPTATTTTSDVIPQDTSTDTVAASSTDTTVDSSVDAIDSVDTFEKHPILLSVSSSTDATNVDDPLPIVDQQQLLRHDSFTLASTTTKVDADAACVETSTPSHVCHNGNSFQRELEATNAKRMASDRRLRNARYVDNLAWWISNGLLSKTIALINDDESACEVCSFLEKMIEAAGVTNESIHAPLTESAKLLDLLAKEGIFPALFDKLFSTDDSNVFVAIAELLSEMMSHLSAPSDDAHPCVSQLADSLPLFAQFLTHPTQLYGTLEQLLGQITVSWGAVNVPLGAARLAAVDFIADLVQSELFPFLATQLYDSNIIPIILDLFFQYEHCNMLHQLVMVLVQSVIVSPAGEQSTDTAAQSPSNGVWALQCQIVKLLPPRLLSAYKANQELVFMSGNKKRLGNIGHVVVLSALFETMQSAELLRVLELETPAWISFRETQLCEELIKMARDESAPQNSAAIRGSLHAS